ncbi:transmembrane ascorbate-dependent reductase CYB561 isoform X3 [Corvus hawaiiensis]|uniref:transmembrane ascorbate-dependent reductase CYB561 isoform X3 n=2 Tax=Corvus TaxID=30420 RepID=UPI002018B6EE|nr:transmembrane ascorbate-dependent reductase CYB561 isoform X3 [Corvus hawaiiensis]
MPGVQLPLALSSLRCRANALAVSLLRHCHRWAWHRQHHPAPTAPWVRLPQLAGGSSPEAVQRGWGRVGTLDPGTRTSWLWVTGKRRGGCDSGGGGSNPSRDNPAQSTTQAAMDGAPPPTSPTGLSAYVAVSQLLGLTLLATTGAWLGRYRGGVAWHSPLQFNAHPLCMVLGMVFLQGDALLVYRVFRHEAKRSTKALHALLHGLALVIALVGIIAVFESHRTKGIPNMYSLHSWCGMAAFVLYLLQWLLGCGFFLFPGASFSVRGQYKPQHIFFGITLFILSITSCLLGITEMLLFKISDSYSHFVPEGILANTLGVLLVAFGLVVCYVLTREEWKRPPLAEEMALSMDFKTLTEGESPSGGSQ